MPIEQVVPKLLEHVDIGRWQRPAALLRVVALLSRPPCYVPLSPSVLVSLGRTPTQAKYDHRVLVRLAEDRVLRRAVGRGRTPDCWAVNPDVTHWEHIPWLTPRAVLVRELLAPLWGDADPLWGVRAGQSPDLWGDTPLISEVRRFLTSTLTPPDRTTTVFHSTTTVGSPGQTGPSTHHYGSPSAPPVCSSESSREDSLSRSEGASEDPLTREARTLIEAVRKASGAAWIRGVPAKRIAACIDPRPDMLGELLAVADACRGARSFLSVIDALESSVAAVSNSAGAPGPGTAARLEGLRRHLQRTLEFDPDCDVTDLLEQIEELQAALGSPLAVPAEG